MRRLTQVLRRVRQHVPPRGRRWLNAEADERDRGLGEDQLSDLDHAEDDDEREDVRHDVPDHQPQWRAAHRTRGKYVLAFTQRDRLPARVVADAEPAEETQEHRERERLEAPEETDDEQQIGPRDAVERGHEPDDDVIPPAAEVPGGDARRQADRSEERRVGKGWW